MLPFLSALRRTVLFSCPLIAVVHLPINAEVVYDASIPQISFAAEAVERAMGNSAGSVTFEVQPEHSNPESFSIKRPNPTTVHIIGSDAAGAMYGGFEVAELMESGGMEAVEPDTQAPYMGMRGIKFNIPLDVRTPSYSDLGDSGQQNIETVWDFSFWTEYIDAVAAHRYNYISLWSLHPFPSLIRVPEYPDVALDDVKRAKALEKKGYDGKGRYYNAPEIIEDAETLIKLSMDEKIEFWRRVMAYGKRRNVDFYIVTWNVFDYGIEGKYGIDDQLDNPVTIDYFRKSVRQLLVTYPDLKGIGVTTGENMRGISHQEKEDWMLQTYGMGVLDYLETDPKREITFLHRQHQAGASAIADTFQALIEHPQVDFIFSYKYAQAHAYSSVNQPFYRKFARELEGRDDDLKTIWTMRNDSTYLHRWAAPNFLREFVRNIPVELTRGYYFGSDGWIWGREFIRKDIETPRPLEIKLHWFQWMLWGRLAYDPNISDERFASILQVRFPEVDASKFLKAWEQASMVFPLVTGFHWGPLDYHWYPEAGIGFPRFARTETGFHDVERFITLPTHPGSDYTSITEYVDILKNNDTFQGIGPLEVAEELLQNAEYVLTTIEAFDAQSNAELQDTIQDMIAMAQLSQYYGHKIRGATYLHRYRELKDPADQSAAIDALTVAADVWRIYAAGVIKRFSHPLWLNRIRTGPIDFNQITEWVDQDIEIARNSGTVE